MMKKYLNKYTLSLISAVFAGAGFVIGCAGGWWGIEEATNYTPELFVDSVYKPFYYSGDYFYYSINYDEAQNERFSKQITNDWHNWFEKKQEIKEIELLLLNSTSKTLDSIQKGGAFIPERFAGSKILKSKDKKAVDFMNYLVLAKQAETFALRNEDDWAYYDKPAKKRSSSAVFCKSVLDAYKKSGDKFIKQRLWFQLVRAYFFNEDYINCVNTFENYQDADKSILYYRSMSYAAGAYKKQWNIAKANYYYSLVYNNCDLLKTTAHFSFKPQEEKDWLQTLALCKNTDEKCTLWQMLSIFYKDELRSIKEILKLDAKSPKLDLLLSRAINKTENNLFVSYYVGSSSEEDDNESRSKMAALKTVVEEAVKKGNLSKPYQWQIALGYLQTLSKEYSLASQNFSAARNSSGSNALIKDEIRILELINTLSELKAFDEKAENKLLTEFKWLEKADKALRKNAVNVWLKKTMAKKYRDSGQLLKAEFFQTDFTYYSNENRLHEMQSFLEKKNKTPYEEYCTSIYNLKLNDLYEFEAIDKALSDRTEEAIAIMEKAPVSAAINLLSNPFNGGIKDCHDCDHALLQKIKYSKLLTLKKIKEMKDKLPTDTYSNALLLGNVYYSMTYFGSSRVFYDCAIFNTDRISKSAGTTYADKITDMALAVKYYTIALNAAQNDEQKAKCLYMLSKCERNEWYNKGLQSDGRDFAGWKSFADLKKLSSTKYYKEVIKECGYFKKYALK